MKKLLLLILSCVLSLSATSVMTFADETSSYCYAQEVPGVYWGIIVDETGRVEEMIPMPNSNSGVAPYVDTVITLQPGKSLITYQYQPTTFFVVAFHYFDAYGNPVTTRDCELEMEIYNSDSIGGIRSYVMGGKFSTNYEDINKYPVDAHGWVSLDVDGNISASKPYYNGKYTNLSTGKTLNVRIAVWSN